MDEQYARPDPPTGVEAETRRERLVEWVLLDGRRSDVATAIAVVVFLFLLSLSLSGLLPLVDVQSLFYVYSGLIAGNITLVTVVVSINQLLLSRQLQTPGEVRSQIDEVIDYRSEVEEATEEIAPVEPLGFLQLLVEGTREEAQRLGGLVRDGVVEEEAAAEAIDGEVERLTEGMDHLDELLAQSGGDTIEVLSLLLETNYAREINRLRRLKERYVDAIDDPVTDCVDALIERLQEIDVARQYFKTIYLQQELSRLSRLLVYVGVPAVAVAMASLLVLTVPADAPEAVPGLVGIVLVSLTVGMLPLAVLCSYSLRMATVTNLTAATLPFTTPEQER